MMASSPIPSWQVMSDLLTIREKGVLISLLEPHSKLIKTTVAQVLQASVISGESPSWHRLDCGVLCLIKDESLHSYFLRLYCVKRAKLLWEQEIYIPFNYTASRSYFHTFPAEVHQVGLNFANEVEAEEFHLAVKTVHETITNMIDLTKGAPGCSVSSDKPHLGNESKEKRNEDKDSYLSPPSITASPAKSSFEGIDPTMRRLLAQASLSEEDLKEKDIAEAVDCIINKFGGLKAVQRELSKRGGVSHTLPRAAGASISFNPQMGSSQSKHCISNYAISESGSLCSDTLNRSQSGALTSSLPPATEGKRRSGSFKHASSKDKGDSIVTALEEVFKQKQLIQQKKTENVGYQQ